MTDTIKDAVDRISLYSDGTLKLDSEGYLVMYSDYDALAAKLAEAQKDRDTYREWWIEAEAKLSEVEDDCMTELEIAIDQRDDATAVAHRARRNALDAAAKVAEAIMKKYAAEAYSDKTVKVFTSSTPTRAQSAAKVYCAGEIIEAIRALPDNTEEGEG